MVRLITTDCFNYNDLETNIPNGIKIFAYHHFEEHSCIASKDDLKDTLYSLNVVSKIHLPKEKFLIYMNDFEYSICFNHKTIYSLKLIGKFKINDIIKSVLITKNLIMLLSAGEIDKVYYIIDSKYEELYKNLLEENLKNAQGGYIVERLGTTENLVKKLPELETLTKFLFKYLTLGTAFIIAILFTFNTFNRNGDTCCELSEKDKLLTKINGQNIQLKKNEENFTRLNQKYFTLFDCIQKDKQ
jgi:hypothetical protein